MAGTTKQADLFVAQIVHRDLQWPRNGLHSILIGYCNICCFCVMYKPRTIITFKVTLEPPSKHHEKSLVCIFFFWGSFMSSHKLELMQFIDCNLDVFLLLKMGYKKRVVELLPGFGRRTASVSIILRSTSISTNWLLLPNKKEEADFARQKFSNYGQFIYCPFF